MCFDCFTLFFKGIGHTVSIKSLLPHMIAHKAFIYANMYLHEGKNPSIVLVLNSIDTYECFEKSIKVTYLCSFVNFPKLIDGI